MAQEQEIRFVAVGRTDVGRVREHNEDNFLAEDLTPGKRYESGDEMSGVLGRKGLALVVADGMGGAAAGEVASQMAVDHLHEDFSGADLGGSVQSDQDIIGLIESAVHKANAAIFALGSTSKEHQGMGTTLTVAVVVNDRLFLSQVGDSRGYIMRKGKLTQMTRDQSLITQLIEEGTLTPEQAETLGGKNIILQALGVEENLKIDSKPFELVKGDTLMLCSDGLTGMVKDEEIQRILLEETDVKRATQRLIDAANEGGGKDNITVIVARFDGAGLREPLQTLEGTEKAGSTFVTKPVVVKKTGRNAMIGAVIALLVMAAFLFRPRDAHLKITVDTEDGSKVTATVEVSLEEGGGDPLAKGDVESGAAYEADVSRAKLKIRISAPGFQPTEFSENTDQGALLYSKTVNLVRIPAKSFLLKPPVYKGRPLTDVRVKLESARGGRTESLVIPKAPDSPQFKEFPAGQWTATVSRGGFAPKTETIEVPSDVDHVVQLPALDEQFGTIQLSEAWKDGEVMVYDGDEPLLERPATIDVTRRMAVKVRATSVRVVVTGKNHAPFEEPRLEVKAEETVNLSLAAHPAMISFVGGEEGATLNVTPSGGRGISFGLDKDGRSKPRAVPPGELKINYVSMQGVVKEGVQAVEPGEIREVDLKKLGQ